MGNQDAMPSSKAKQDEHTLAVGRAVGTGVGLVGGGVTAAVGSGVGDAVTGL